MNKKLILGMLLIAGSATGLEAQEAAHNLELATEKVSRAVTKGGALFLTLYQNATAEALEFKRGLKQTDPNYKLETKYEKQIYAGIKAYLNATKKKRKLYSDTLKKELKETLDKNQKKYDIATSKQYDTFTKAMKSAKNAMKSAKNAMKSAKNHTKIRS